MENIDKVIIGAGSVLTAILSLWVRLRTAKTKNLNDKARNKKEHTETILGGYSQIVDDLRREVDRLNETIVDLRKEQEECERRNEEMAKVVEELRQRVSYLEGDQSA